MISEDKIFEIIKSYVEYNDFATLQRDSYENLINVYLQKIIEEEPKIIITPKKNSKYIITFEKIFVDNPYIIEEDRTINYITPNEARLRDLTYSGTVSVNIEETLIENNMVVESKIHNKVPIARIPIMLQTSKCNIFNKNLPEKIKEGECEYDRGGYFIVKGKERVIISQERLNYNIVYIFQQKLSSKYLYVAEIRSMSNETGHSVLVKGLVTKTKMLCFSLPYIQQDIPVGIVFKALGYTSDEDIRDIINLKDRKYNNLINTILRESFFIKDKKEALNYISDFTMHIIQTEKKEIYSEQMLDNELFPHLGILSTNKERAILLGMMINKLIRTFTKDRVPDDRDHISNKRFESTGILIGDIFRALYKRFIRSLTPQLQKRQDIITVIGRNNSITHGIRHCFSTGNWGIQKNSYIRTGVSQILQRLTWGATISHLRRLIIPVGKEGKNTDIRQIHASQYGFVDPVETPEGHQSGIVKNFALMTKISNKIPNVEIIDFIKKLDSFIGIGDIDIKKDLKNYKILLNGTLLGITLDKNKFITKFKQLRKNKIINSQVSISYQDDDNEILIFSDEGRLLRPLFVVQNKKLDISETSWEKLLDNNTITYVDHYELENHTLAMYEKEIEDYTDYCEIHPSVMLGICSSIIPYPDHTQAPRNSYYGAMSKQALGIYALSNSVRCDTVVHILHYPQKPIVKTKYSKLLNYDDLPSGVNVIMAIACYTGYNMEDSVIFNKSAIDRGLFRSFLYRTVCVEEKKTGTNVFENICVPKLDIRIKNYNYSKLDQDGIIFSEKKVSIGDVLVGKIIVKIDKNGKEYREDRSISVKQGEEGVVDKVFITTNPDGYRIIKIKIRSNRIPEVGDKVVSREAQKGTIGMIFAHEDMPFTADGMVPDLILNPHAIPSRMTINQLMEGLGAKSSVMKGEFRDCTPFTENSTDIIGKLCEDLGEMGYEKHGNEVMYSGFTGDKMDAQIFMSPVYYQRLKHLVHDKIHARDFGNVQALVRQPGEGRSRDGGLRFGEMERDCMISHGVSRFLKERLFDMSDPYQVLVCNNCGQIVVNKDECNVCHKDVICKINIPYACKLLFQELMAMGIKIELRPNIK